MTLAAAIRLPKNGSSPAPSITLPHLASLDISTIGANVQLIPAAEASFAPSEAEFWISFRSQLADSANGIGAIVL